jgi:hypothetical protein
MSIYKKFRSVNEVEAGSLSSRYDQPTYMTFKLEFAQNGDATYNDAGKSMYRTLNYDTMPHPLFGEQGANDINTRETYSAIDYLIDSNEYTRAKMLKEFIAKFNELQQNFQWYFKSVEGLEDLMTVKVDSGQRVLSDKRLTIHMIEGIDLRITHLMNLYRKIAWDDTYQRWVLPEMMRYFTLQIYISEFRTFHQAIPNEQGNAQNKNDLVLSILDNILPTWIIKCEMCEFDIESFKFGYLSALDVSETPSEAAVSFNIKVGKIYETQTYPLFKNAYLVDKYINGANRLIEKQGYDKNGYIKNYDHTSGDEENNYIKNLYNINVAQNTITDTLSEQNHTSGLPFNQNANETTLIDSANTNKNTWISNALTSGVALATNYANEWVDKLKMTPIPGLGASVTEMGAALESKNIFTAIGMVRKAVKTAADELIDPSEKLSEQIIDSGFAAFLKAVVDSAATNSTGTNLTYAANLALNDKGVWEALKDFSKSTDMVGQGENNIPSRIENPDIYKNIMITNTGNDRSKATDLDGGPAGISGELIMPANNSMATNNKLVL